MCKFGKPKVKKLQTKIYGLERKSGNKMLYQTLKMT